MAYDSSGFAGDIHTAVGKSDVVMMHYELKIGTIDNKGDLTLLADTYSYKTGTSLSEIKWGFVNSGSFGDKTDANITFTLHDIAGETFQNFMKLQTGSYWIYFKGPDSTGSLWSGDAAIYVPDREGCSVEFSPTQGFTYTFTGKPMLMHARSEYVTNTEEIEVNGWTEPGTNFMQFLSELETEWNTAAKNHNKCNAKTIKLNFGNPSNKLWLTPIHRVEKTEENVRTIEPYKIAAGKTISDAIIDFFNIIFLNEKGVKNDKPTIEVNFEKTEGDIIHIDVKIWGLEDEKSVISSDKICIGTDDNCNGSRFRGQLVGMDFKPLLALLATQVIDEELANTGTGKGSAETIGQCLPEKNTPIEGQTHTQVTGANNPHEFAADGSWAGIDTLLNKLKFPKFVIEVELPYSYGFTPKIHGGLLKDAIEGSTGGGIHIMQGTQLDFFWYTSPDCDKLDLVKGISNKYRISTVTHTIGLNGNSTQIKLSHLYFANQ